MGERTENGIGFVCESNSGEFISIPHVKSETVVINQHIGGILRELRLLSRPETLSFLSAVTQIPAA